MSRRRSELPIRRPNRRPASRHLGVIDALNAAMIESRVTRVVVADLVGIEYITLDKYLRKERNVLDDEIAKRMVATTELLNKLIAKELLPIPREVNARLRSGVVFDIINDYVEGKL